MTVKLLNEIYNDLLNRDVLVFSGDYHFSGDCDAATIKINQHFGVFLDIDKIRTLRQEKEAVVHEWAHIACDATYGVDAPASVKQKAETRASRVEIEVSVPFADLRKAIWSGITTTYELSEHFNVTESMIDKAIEYYLGPCGLTFNA